MIDRIALENFKKAIYPNRDELWYSLILTLFMVIMATIPTMVVEFGLLGLQEIVRSRATSSLAHFLISVDQLSFTATVVTFVFWMFVGAVVLGVLSVVYTSAKTLGDDLETSSDEYVHPQSFSRLFFWREVARGVLLYVAGAALILLFLIVTIFILLPAATVHMRQIIIEPEALAIFGVIASIGLLVSGIWAIIQAVKIWWHRNLLLG